MHLTASIKQGTVTASLILRKLAAYPRENSLATGLREYGRLERTLFTLKWLRDPALRRRTTGGLNKREARNALARTVFFHRLGEIRDRSYENQRYWHTNKRVAKGGFRPLRRVRSMESTVAAR